DRRIADAAGGRDAFAQPDDAGERIDHTEAVARRPRDEEPAIVGAEIECGIGRSGATVAALRAVVARMAVGRAPTPPGPLRRHPLTDRVEAAGCRALVLHQIPSCRAEALGLNGSGFVRTKIEPSVARGSLAQQMRVGCMTQLDILVERPRVLYLNRAADRLNAGGPMIPWSC